MALKVKGKKKKHTGSVQGGPKAKIRMNQKVFEELAAPIFDQGHRSDVEYMPPVLNMPGGLSLVEEDGKGGVKLGRSLFSIEKAFKGSKGGADDIFGIMSDIRMFDNVQYRQKISSLKLFDWMFHWHNVFGETMDAFAPRINVLVEYPLEQLVYWGNEMPSQLLMEKPKVNFQLQEVGTSGGQFTFVIFSYDESTGQYYDHYVVSNLSNDQLETGDESAAFLPTQPLHDKGIFRYMYVLLDQNHARMQLPSRPENIEDRSDFNLKEFMTENKLTPKGIVFCNVVKGTTTKNVSDLAKSKLAPALEHYDTEFAAKSSRAKKKLRIARKRKRIDDDMLLKKYPEE
eukprot:TRINITY_DN2467_c0_g1_i2.p1 TRINITY_DN2467_c0_g1~~TRINITY_DN2467_c0_g1_i2.p1  ORF type:complete len:393 (+),score=109.00 TRINITY_DN2467_c0_g1_i2:151-1179(+)